MSRTTIPTPDIEEKTMTRTRTRNPKRNSFLADVLTTAMEGGIGYWSCATSYEWFDPDMTSGTASPAPGGGGNAYATLELTEVPDGGDTVRELNLDTVAVGLRKISSGEVQVSSKARRTVTVCNISNSTAPEDFRGDIDADLADQIVQAGMFGDVVFG